MRIRDYRNRDFQIIGKRVERDDGRIEMREPDGRLLGWYDPMADETREPDGAIVGRGDLLAALLDEGAGESAFSECDGSELLDEGCVDEPSDLECEDNDGDDFEEF